MRNKDEYSCPNGTCICLPEKHMVVAGDYKCEPKPESAPNNTIPPPPLPSQQPPEAGQNDAGQPPLTPLETGQHDTRPRQQPAPAELYHCPPIGGAILMHHFNYPDHIINTSFSCYRQIPKRTGGKVAGSAESMVQCWGLYLEEGWDRDRLLLSIVVIIVLSLVFAVTWTVVRDDISGGWTVAATWVAIAATLRRGRD